MKNAVDDYIAAFDEPTRSKLTEIRNIIRKAAPDAEEVISYNMPAYRQKGILVYFAANKNHIGFYPTPDAIEAFAEALTAYKTSKGAVQFPYHQPLPTDLIQRIVKYRIEQNSSNIHHK